MPVMLVAGEAPVEPGRAGEAPAPCGRVAKVAPSVVTQLLDNSSARVGHRGDVTVINHPEHHRVETVNSVVFECLGHWHRVFPFRSAG